MPVRCDIFCNVIDNYGDIGVCWRLARQLARADLPANLSVRLWVDDLASFAKLCPELDVSLSAQVCREVEICLWAENFPKSEPADWVIEAFACKLPVKYLAAMAARSEPPVWFNLEYLSAENWVTGCHKLPSPHPTLPLTKYFFFPGFTPQTGGLLLEQNLLAQREAFLNDAAAQQAYWLKIGIEIPAPNTLKISLFAYENAALPSLFDAWSQGAQKILCLVPEGRILPQIEQYFQGENSARGNLQIHVLPFVAQEDYDTLLWACDVNFVRGEDSFVRAQWAGKPLVWQIYPQHDAVHQEKLQAFLDLYTASLNESARDAVQGLWRVWNVDNAAKLDWSAFFAARAELAAHALNWADELAKNNLALNLLDFYAEIGKIRAFKIEGQ